jgi:hypothetical protein
MPMKKKLTAKFNKECGGGGYKGGCIMIEHNKKMKKKIISQVFI